MTTVVLTATGAGTFLAGANGLIAGQQITSEAWGGGSGGSGTGATEGGGGAGGAYVSSTYTLTPNDITNGIAYSIGIGGAGNTGVGSVGGNTSFSTNNVNMIYNTTMAGAVVGSPGTLPTDWGFDSTVAGLSSSVIGFGVDQVAGSYIDVNFSGTPTATGYTQLDFWIPSGAPASASTAYVGSAYFAVVGGSTTGIVGIALQSAAFDAGTYLSGPFNTPVTGLTSSLQRFTGTASTPTTTTSLTLFVAVGVTNGTPVNLTLRIAGIQLEAGSTATFWKSTPGYALALGGAAPIGTAGGIGTATGSIGSLLTYAGGSGAAYNASGSGGGGAAGPSGAGANGTAVGVGGQGDNGSGGAGGAVKTTTPGNPGTANVNGGGGGGALTTVAGVGGAGGAPGGGGGGSDFTSGTRTGGTGAAGQIRLTFSPLASFLRQPAAIQLWS